jgi:hypothetical protein
MEADQDFHSKLVDVAFVLIHVVIVGDHRVGEFGVAFEFLYSRLFYAASGSKYFSSHHPPQSPIIRHAL